MPLSLNHYSVRTLDLAASRQFYETVLGLSAGPRPDFPFPGHWMYRGDHGDIANAAVHLIGIDPADARGLQSYLGDREPASLKGSGAVDHIAFFADGLAPMLSHLRGLGVSFTERTVPGIGLHQLFLTDPDGVVIELNYPASELAGLPADAAAVAAG